MNANEAQRRLSAARRAANRAGEYLRTSQWDAHEVTLKGVHDLHLDADTEAGQRIAALLATEFPGEFLLEEDGPPDPGTSEWVWVIDPLDGTVNYFHRLPWYCVSIACYHRTEASVHPLWRHGRPVASVVLAPALGLEFWAMEGHGAWSDGRRLRVSAEALSHGILSHSRGSRPDDQAFMRERMALIGSEARKTRSHGAAALDLALVAQGSLVAHVQRSLQAWDVAAGVHLVLEAGGSYWAEEGEGGQHTLVGGPGVFPRLKEVFS